MTRVGVLTWDWRSQPDIAALDRIVADLSGGTIRIQSANTGSDEYAVVISAGGLSPAGVADAYQEWALSDSGDFVEVDT